MNKIFVFIIMSVLLSACSIKQTIEPAEITKGVELCIIENPKVRPGFLVELKSVLASKRILFKVVSETAVPSDCEWTATYVGRWTWDLALYLVYAEIKIFHNGSLDGEAIYDATWGGANLGKFIDAEPKIRELVDKLMRNKSVYFFRQVGRTVG